MGTTYATKIIYEFAVLNFSRINFEQFKDAFRSSKVISELSVIDDHLAVGDRFVMKGQIDMDYSWFSKIVQESALIQVERTITNLTHYSQNRKFTWPNAAVVNKRNVFQVKTLSYDWQSKVDISTYHGVLHENIPSAPWRIWFALVKYRTRISVNFTGAHYFEAHAFTDENATTITIVKVITVVDKGQVL